MSTKLDKLLKEAKPIFKQVDVIGKSMREQDDLDLEFYTKSLAELSGCYTYIAPRFKTLRATKLNQEASKFMELKLKADVDKTSFTAASANKHASNSVKDMRLARDVFEGYLLATDIAISTCKYYINSYYREKEIDKIANS